MFSRSCDGKGGDSLLLWRDMKADLVVRERHAPSGPVPVLVTRVTQEAAGSRHVPV